MKVWADSNKSDEVTLPQSRDLSSQSVPSHLYVEGVAASLNVRGVGLKLSYLYNSTPIHADPVRMTVVEADLDIDGLTDAEEEDPGGDCIVNHDDDNQNGTADREETGTVTGENELKRVYLAIRPAALNLGEVKLEATGGLGKYALWEASTKGAQVTLPRTWNLASESPPSSLWVEGIEASDSVADIPFELSHHLEGATVHEDRANFTVFDIGPPGGGMLLGGGEIQSVGWAKYDFPDQPNLEPNTHPSGTLGLRIFPGKISSTDDHAEYRKKVYVIAQVYPHEPNVTVHFRVFDVDDPSASTTPIDNESSAYDNRGGAATLENLEPTPTPTNEAQTDGDGKATLVMNVTMKPGDNFRVVASLTTEYFNHIQARQSDTDGRIEWVNAPGSFIPDKYQTEVLTVWRKLFVEVDSMGSEPLGYDFAEAAGTSTSLAARTLSDTSADWPEGQWVGGKINPNTDQGTDFDIIDNGYAWVVVPEGSDMTTVADVGDPYDIVDDFFRGNVPDPNILALNDAFDDAYILIIPYEQESSSSTPWNKNFNCSPQMEFDDCVQQCGTDFQDVDWWSAYVAGHYENSVAGDNNDPDPSVGALGATLRESNPPYRIYCCIYSETLRDQAEQHGWTPGDQVYAEQGTVIHEFGHLFELEDHFYPTNVMYAPHDEEGENDQITVPLIFLAGHIDKIRNNTPY